MHVSTDSLTKERRLAIEAAVELANDLVDGGDGFRAVLVDKRYARAAEATEDELDQVRQQYEPIAAIVRSLPTAELADAVTGINASLERHVVDPTLTAHNGSPLHIHWTAEDAAFDTKVIVDLLMALSETVCAEGIERFGVCDASDCDHVFYDPTKNHSRRFCADPRCASRTHTAEHRRRRRAAGA